MNPLDEQAKSYGESLWLTVTLTEEFPLKSGDTTAHLTTGEDTLVVVDKMLREQGFVDWEAVPANDYTLQVDLDMDREAATKLLEPVLPLLCRRVPSGLKWAMYDSKSGKHTHTLCSFCHFPWSCMKEWLGKQYSDLIG